MVTIELKINRNLLTDIVKEKKMLSCLKDKWGSIPLEFRVTISDEFLISNLAEYEKQQPTDYLQIKIGSQNGK